jgi:hypothetical protein
MPFSFLDVTVRIVADGAAFDKHKKPPASCLHKIPAVGIMPLSLTRTGQNQEEIVTAHRRVAEAAEKSLLAAEKPLGSPQKTEKTQ